jgi:hypothetical protein
MRAWPVRLRAAQGGEEFGRFGRAQKMRRMARQRQFVKTSSVDTTSTCWLKRLS